MTTQVDAWIELVGEALVGLDEAVKRMPHSSGCGIHTPRHVRVDATTFQSIRECSCPRRLLVEAFQKAQTDVRRASEEIPQPPALARLLAAIDEVYAAMAAERPGASAVRALDEMRWARKGFGP